MRRQEHAIVGNGAVGANELHHGDRDGLAKGHRAGRAAVILLRSPHDALDLARKVDARLGANPVARHALGEALRTDDLLDEQRHSRVGGAPHHLSHRHGLGVVAAVVIGHVVVAHKHLGRDRVDGLGIKQAEVKANGGREHLEDGTRLVGARDRLEVECGWVGEV